jgi:cobalt/nickel transport system permease protein
MHHVVLEQWARRTGPVHALDPRVKLGVTLLFLIAIAAGPPLSVAQFAAYAGLLAGVVLAAGLPLGGVALRAGIVLPLAGAFAAVSWLAGDSHRGLTILLKSYLSVFAALTLVGTTPVARLFLGLKRLGVPASLVLVVQFVYRYLFVISEQVQHMRLAAKSRGALERAPRRYRLMVPAGAIAVLFARSYRRAEAVHHAMLARGFTGQIEAATPLRLGAADLVAGGAAAGVVLAVRFAF